MEEVKKEDLVVKEGKVFAILAYIGILCLIPLLVKKENKFAFFHAKTGVGVIHSSSCIRHCRHGSVLRMDISHNRIYTNTYYMPDRHNTGFNG